MKSNLLSSKSVDLMLISSKIASQNNVRQSIGVPWLGQVDIERLAPLCCPPPSLPSPWGYSNHPEVGMFPSCPCSPTITTHVCVSVWQVKWKFQLRHPDSRWGTRSWWKPSPTMSAWMSQGSEIWGGFMASAVVGELWASCTTPNPKPKASTGTLKVTEGSGESVGGVLMRMTLKHILAQRLWCCVRTLLLSFSPSLLDLEKSETRVGKVGEQGQKYREERSRRHFPLGGLTAAGLRRTMGERLSILWTFSLPPTCSGRVAFPTSLVLGLAMWRGNGMPADVTWIKCAVRVHRGLCSHTSAIIRSTCPR